MHTLNICGCFYEIEYKKILFSLLKWRKKLLRRAKKVQSCGEKEKKTWNCSWNKRHKSHFYMKMIIYDNSFFLASVSTYSLDSGHTLIIMNELKWQFFCKKKYVVAVKHSFWLKFKTKFDSLLSVKIYILTKVYLKIILFSVRCRKLRYYAIIISLFFVYVCESVSKSVWINHCIRFNFILFIWIG